MRNFIWFALLAFCGLSLACPSYPYHDFHWASDYRPPVRPPDTLLDNCYSLGIDRAVCDAAGDHNLTEQQRKQLILDALVNGSGPGYPRADSWNDGLKFTGYPPDGTASTSSGSIKDAWVKIVSLSPSIYDSEKNKTWINDSGKLRNEYSFSFVVERKAFPGDCATNYDICGYDYALETFQDGVRIGTGLQVPFNETGGAGHPNRFKTLLTVSSEYQIEHYELVTHCTSGPDGEFCWTVCEYSHMDDITDRLVISDEKTAYYYGFFPLASSIVESYERGLADLWIFAASNEDFNRYEFKLGNSYLETEGMEYRHRYDYPPYNVITPEAFRSPSKSTLYGLSVLGQENATMTGPEFGDYLQRTEPFLYSMFLAFGVDFASLPTFYGEKAHLLVPADSLNCNLTLYSHFSSQTYSDFCILTDQTPVIELEITNMTSGWFTVKVRFYDNMTGELLTGKDVVLSYGGQTLIARTDPGGLAYATFNYTTTSGFVVAKFTTDFHTKSAEARLVIPPRPLTAWEWLTTAILIFVFSWLAVLLIERWLSRKK